MSVKTDPLIQILRKYEVISKSDWALARGIPSKYFFDLDKAAYSPESVSVTLDKYAEKIKELRKKEPKIDRLAFIEKDFGTVGALLLMSSIVLKAGIDGSIIRLRRETSLGEVKGAKITDDNYVLIVSDVLTSGEGVEKAFRIIAKYGAKVPYAVFLYDREQGGRERLNRIGIEVEAILNKRQLVKTGDVPDYPETKFGVDGDMVPLSRRKLKEMEEMLGPESSKISNQVIIIKKKT